MATLFTHVLDGMVENNKMNHVGFDTWDDAEHAIDTYEDSHVGPYPDSIDITIAKHILNKLICKEIAEHHARDLWGKWYYDGLKPWHRFIGEFNGVDVVHFASTVNKDGIGREWYFLTGEESQTKSVFEKDVFIKSSDGRILDESISEIDDYFKVAVTNVLGQI